MQSEKSPVPASDLIVLLAPVAAAFAVSGRLISATENHSGIINRTYLLLFETADGIRKYTLQQMNTYVFHDPVAVMDNIRLVTEHLKRKLQKKYPADYDRRTLSLILTKAGETCYDAGKDGVWRMFTYIDCATAYDTVRNPADFYCAGTAFGEFQGLLADFPADALHEIIPGFHDTPARLAALFESAAADPMGRAKEVGGELDFFFAQTEKMHRIAALIAEGALPLRVTHNDTKFNNVLLDDQTGDALCVIDLDTVMPGTALFDFGDAIRYGASTAREDEADISKIHLDKGLYEAFSAGFLSACGDLLTETELTLLPLGAEVITLELASRFLKDYLDGDRYFKTAYAGQNLVRARAQIALAKDMTKQLSAAEQNPFQKHRAGGDLL